MAGSAALRTGLFRDFEVLWSGHSGLSAKRFPGKSRWWKSVFGRPACHMDLVGRCSMRRTDLGKLANELAQFINADGVSATDDVHERKIRRRTPSA
jgi:hypothetical protein